jgi:hypothetical protein
MMPYLIMLTWDFSLSGIRGVTGQDHVVMMVGAEQIGHVPRAMTAMTNITQVPTR